MSSDDSVTVLLAQTGTLVHLSATGQTAWKRVVSAGNGGAGLTGSNAGSLYVTLDDGHIASVDPNSGAPNWSVQPTSEATGLAATSPDGDIYFAAYSLREAYALHADGSMIWSAPLGAGPTAGPCVGSNGDVYYGTDDGSVIAISASGKQHWKTATDASVVGVATSSDGTLFAASSAGSTSGMSAIDVTGHVQWKTVLPTAAGVPVITSSDNVVVPSEGGALLLLTSMGSMAGQVAIGGNAVESLAISADGTLYVGSTDGRLYAVSATR